MQKQSEIELITEDQERKLISGSDSPDKLPKLQAKPPQLKVIYDLSIATACLSGSSNFIYSLLESKDFPTSCLSFSGFLAATICFRFVDNWKNKISNKGFIMQFFKYYRDENTGKIQIFNLLNTLLRSINHFVCSWLIIIASAYAKQANINYGIISSCVSISCFLNTIFSYFMFNERVSIRQLVGMILIVGGIIVISTAKYDNKIIPIDEKEGLEMQVTLTEDDITYYKVMSILCSIGVGTLHSIRAMQGKYVCMKTQYRPQDFSVDAALFSGIVTMVIAAFYFVSGYETYNLYNFGVIFIGSSMFVIGSFVGLVANVKGLAGPSSAIMQGQVIITIALNAIFYGQLPTLTQIAGSFIAIFGVIIMMIKF